MGVGEGVGKRLGLGRFLGEGSTESSLRHDPRKPQSAFRGASQFGRHSERQSGAVTIYGACWAGTLKSISGLFPSRGRVGQAL